MYNSQVHLAFTYMYLVRVCVCYVCEWQEGPRVIALSSWPTPQREKKGTDGDGVDGTTSPLCPTQQ
jgi:hypothetical protein